MQRTNIYLDEAQIEELDRLASGRHTSRAEVVRLLIDRGLHARGKDLDDDVAAFRESFGALTADDLVDTDREVDDRQRHLDRLLDA